MRWYLTPKKTLTFSKAFCTVANDLLAKLSSPSLRLGLLSVKLPNSKSKFTFVSEKTVLKIPKDMDENKAAGLFKSNLQLIYKVSNIFVWL